MSERFMVISRSLDSSLTIQSAPAERNEKGGDAEGLLYIQAPAMPAFSTVRSGARLASAWGKVAIWLAPVPGFGSRQQFGFLR